jgi:hypothetical protein
LPNGATPAGTYFFVSRLTTASTVQALFMYGPNTLTTGANPQFYYNASNQLAVDTFGAGGITDSSNLLNSTVILSSTISNTAGTGTVTGWRNGTSFGPATYTTASITSQQGLVGVTKAGAGAGSLLYYFGGNIYEIIVFNGVLSTSQRQQIEGYLAWKWGLTTNLPVTSPYKSIKPFARPFQPTDIDTCKLWLDASDRSTFTLSGTTITQWRDKSGNGDTTSGGTYAATGTLGNSLSNVTINNTYLFTTNQIGISGASPQTYVVVANTSDAVSDFNMLHWLTSGGGNAYTGSMILNVRRDAVTSGINQVGGNITITGLTQAKTKLVITSHTGALANIYESGIAGPTNANTLNQTNGTMRIGIGGGATATVGEIMVYNKALSESERQQLEGYLASKWGLLGNLPSTHSFKLYPPLAPLFTPLLYPSCNLWLDASDSSTITYASGSTVNVSAVRDKGPNSINFTRSYTSGFEITTANKLNGLNTLYFPNDPVNNNNTQTYLGSSTSLTMSGSVNYIFFVMRFNPYVLQGTSTPRGWGYIFPFGVSVAYGVSVGLKRTSTTWNLDYDAAFVGTAALSTASLSTNSSGPSVGTPFLCMIGKTSTSQYVFSINGTYETKAGQNWGHAGGQPLQVGYFYQNQELCEMVIYNGTLLNVGDIQRIEGHLAWKWGIQANLPSTHAYYKFRP